MSGDPNDKILSILQNIQKKNSDANGSTNLQDKSNIVTRRNEDTNIPQIRGKPKSGRFWKSKKERFSSVSKTKGIKLDFQKKTALRLELKRTKELSKQLQEKILEKEQARKERRRDNLKRAEENKRKSEIVQVITNTGKLKRMKKKQLRFIEKRDTIKEVKS